MRYFFAVFIFAFACGVATQERIPENQALHAGSQESIISHDSSGGLIVFRDSLLSGVLVGKSIALLNEKLDTITDVAITEGRMVNILAISDSLYNTTEDHCNVFNYLKISIGNVTGIIDGRFVYHIKTPIVDSVLYHETTGTQIYRTDFFGIGFANEDGLTFCSSYFQPVVIQDLKKNINSLIRVVKNDFFRKASWNGSFDYFELVENDGARDSITRIDFTDSSMILYMHREFQEGYTDFQVEVKSRNSIFVAEYLNYPEIRYE